MTVRNLEFLFRPKSVAVVAEPDAPSRYAEAVRANLAAGGFAGPVVSVEARRRSRFAIGADVRIGELEVVADLAIICAALDMVPSIITQLGARGTRGVIVGPWMWHKINSSQIAAARKAILEAARPHLIRVLGPGSGGLVVPARGLNASASPASIAPGKIALVSQSTAITAAVLDRAHSRGIGFSTVLHLGAGLDVDLADVLDWLAADQDTRSILVQFDEVANGRKFLSAARAAGRNKPVVAIRGGRAETRRPLDSPFTTDDVYEAALRRSGWVRIDTLGDLFEAVEAMARARPLRGEHLTILGNGHGLGRIAGDTLLRSGGQLGSLSPDTLKHLDELLQTRSPLANPLALPPDVRPESWAAALSAVLADSHTDTVLTVCTPSPFAASADVATAICEVSGKTASNVLTCWVGGAAMREAQTIAAANGVLSHDSPEKAIAVFLGVVNYLRNRRLLLQMPPSLAESFTPDIGAARSVIKEAIDVGAAALSARQARRLLEAYGIAVADYPLAGSIATAILAADEIGYPVDLGLVLADGAEFAQVATGLRSPAEIRIAARGLRSSARAQRPGSRVSRYRLRSSVARSGAPAVRLGVADDPVFGLVIFLGPASAARGRVYRVVVALPPLNLVLAQDLVARSRFGEAMPEDDQVALQAVLSNALVRLSQLLTDLDEVTDVELASLHVETSGVVVLDAHIGVGKVAHRSELRRFAIRPYPKELEQRVDWQGRTLLIRPIRPEDETTLGELLNSLSPEDSRMRFFDSIKSLPRARLARFTQIDYDREMALVAIDHDCDGVERSLGEVRAVTDPGGAFADFALVVRSDLKGQGLGRRLLQSLISYGQSCGIGELCGETMDGNLRMQRLAKSLGFTVTTGNDRGILDLRLVLQSSEKA